MKIRNKLVKFLIYLLVIMISLGFSMDIAYCKSDYLNDRKNVGSFFDNFFKENMTQFKIPGVAFTLIKDGDVVLEKGYGYYDVENKKEVDPKKTIFQIESTTKVITAIAAMQLIEKGKLDLDKDINNYLSKFHLKNPYSSPITLHNLLTHTSGLDEKDIEMYVQSKEQLPNLEEYLSEKLPDVIMKPGEVISYNNHGFALVGYLIERVTNMPFDEYISENIITPLNMTRSGIFIDEAFKGDMALNYIYRNGKYERGNNSYHLYTPAGLFRSTVSDMGKFITALLNAGEYKDERILEEKTVNMVYNTQFTQHPNLEGWTYGFYEYFQNNKRVIMHCGDSRFGYSSMLFLIPEENVGVFVAMNGYAHDLCDKLLHKFIDIYYPTKEEVKNPENFKTISHKENFSKFTGNYVHNRYERKTILKIINLFTQLKVREEDGFLIINNHIDNDFPGKWVNSEPLIFRSMKQDRYIVFNENDQRKVDYMFSGRDANYEKVSWYEYDILNQLFIILALIIFITMIIIKSIKLFKEHYKNKINNRIIMKSRLMVLIISILNLCFLIGITLYFFIGDILNIVFNVPVTLKLLFCLPIISVVITFVLFVFNFKNWRNEDYLLSEKVYNTAFILFSSIYVLFLLNWNLLGFNF